MARKHEAVQLLRQGNSPAQIARLMGVSESTVLQYLYTQVGEGAIRRSDIVFAIDRNTREVIESLSQSLGTANSAHIWLGAQERGQKINFSELGAYLALRNARVDLGDMYEYIRQIETDLHDLIQDSLINHYGSDDWWRKGVPNNIRRECVDARENDDEPAPEPYCYTMFIHLKEILDKQWPVISRALPKTFASDKKKLLANLARLNSIRNAVMHPVKKIVLTEDDFAFVRDFRNSLPNKAAAQ